VVAGGEASSATARSTFDVVVDGGVLPRQPRALYDSGDYAKVPYILGSNADEGTLFFIGVPPVTTEAAYLAALQANYGAIADQVAAVYPVSSFSSPQAALARAVGDSSLVCPTYDAARRAAAGGANVYLYNFARPIDLAPLEPLMLGATHGTEIAYVFGSVTPPSPGDAEIATAVQSYWAQLARSGDPNVPGAVAWPRYADATDQRLDFGDGVSVVTGFRRRECDFWFGTYDAEFSR
jgi:para-nitrobenzyl esterase